MHSPSINTAFCAAVLALNAPFAAHANDISIFSYLASQPLDPNDPLMQVMSIEEVDVWARIRKGFAIPDLDNPLVTTQTTWYSARPDYIDRTTTRASPPPVSRAALSIANGPAGTCDTCRSAPLTYSSTVDCALETPRTTGTGLVR